MGLFSFLSSKSKEDRYKTLHSSIDFTSLNVIKSVNKTYKEWVLSDYKGKESNQEIFVKTIFLESIPDRFNLKHFMRYLDVITYDIITNANKTNASEAVDYFVHNIVNYFVNETKCQRFNMGYFIYDCFYLVNYNAKKELGSINKHSN